jgi:hypothetical protein
MRGSPFGRGVNTTAPEVAIFPGVNIFRETRNPVGKTEIPGILLKQSALWKNPLTVLKPNSEETLRYI